MSGYRLAVKEAVKYIKSNLIVNVDSLGKDNLLNAGEIDADHIDDRSWTKSCDLIVAKTSMSSKIINNESNFFAELAVKAALRVKVEKDGKMKCPIGNIHIMKSHGKSALDSELVDGFALNCSRASQAMPTRITNAKIALLDFNLQKHKFQMGVQVVVTDTKQVEEIRQREMDITKEKIHRILASGAKVILTTKGIDDLCMKYFVEAGAIAVRRVLKEDLKRIAKATGGQVVVTMTDMEGEEAFDASCLGECAEVSEERVGDGELIYFRGCKTGQACTVVLRGANELMLEEMDRSLHDCLCVIKRIMESNTLVAGGGTVESALSIYLYGVASSLGSKEQMAVAEFAEALLVIPRTLAINAAQDATELVAQLRAYHNTSQKVAGKEHLRFMGLDLVNGKVRDSIAAGVVEPAISKIKSLRFATEAAISILRIDDMIKLNPPRQQQH